MLYGTGQRVEFREVPPLFFGVRHELSQKLAFEGMTMVWPIDLWLAFRVKYSSRYPSLIKRTARWVAYFYTFVSIINVFGNLAIVVNGYFLGKFKWWEGIRFFLLFGGWIIQDYRLAKIYFEYAKLDYENSQLTPYRALATLHSHSLAGKMSISVTLGDEEMAALNVAGSQEHVTVQKGDHLNSNE